MGGSGALNLCTTTSRVEAYASTYFQTKTIPNNNEKWEIITAARFDHHDQLEEDIQFSPKFVQQYDFIYLNFTYNV